MLGCQIFYALVWASLLLPLHSCCLLLQPFKTQLKLICHLLLISYVQGILTCLKNWLAKLYKYCQFMIILAVHQVPNMSQTSRPKLCHPQPSPTLPGSPRFKSWASRDLHRSNKLNCYFECPARHDMPQVLLLGVVSHYLSLITHQYLAPLTIGIILKVLILTIFHHS